MQIEYLADHPHLIETIARWHWEVWGHTDPDGSLESWTNGMRKRVNRDRLPVAYLALDENELVGSAMLIARDMRTHPELSPWLAGVFVASSRRGQGVGRELVLHAMKQASELGIARLYLHTESARDFYAKLGWRPISEEDYGLQHVTIMAADLPVLVQGA